MPAVHVGVALGVVLGALLGVQPGIASGGGPDLQSEPRGEIIDRVLAVVNGTVITLSDVNAARRFGIVEPADGVDDPLRGVLDALIERQLQLAEVNRYLPPEPSDAAVEAGMVEIRGRFADAVGFDAALMSSGLTIDQLRRAVRDNLRITSYRQQRFGAAMQPAEEDIVRYYRAREAEFTRDGVRRPYTEVRAEARQRLIAERTDTLVRDWIEGLRRRAEILVLPWTTAVPGAALPPDPRRTHGCARPSPHGVDPQLGPGPFPGGSEARDLA